MSNAECRWWFRLACVCVLLVAAAGGVRGGPSERNTARSEYKHSVQIESYSSRLVYLAEYDVGGDDGYFSIALDVLLTVDTFKVDTDRTMLHLVVCDSAAIRRVKNPPVNGSGALVSTQVPSYCAMANRTLDDYCLSFPLEDESADESIYRSQKTIATSSMRDSGYSGNGTLYFLIDACETVGGEQGVLRSCLGRADSKTNDKACFSCPKNFPYANQSSTCIVPQAIQPTIRVHAEMNLCNRNSGECLSDHATTENALPAVYAVFTVLWAVSSIVWLAHIHAFKDNAVIDLQTRMKLVPMAQCAYVGMTCLSLHTETSVVENTAHDFVLNVTILMQLFALSLSAEVVVLIAKGWKITRATLHVREHQWIRFVTLLWATSFAILKHSIVKHMTVFLVWGIAWASVVFMIWYNSAFNMNMLKYQIAMVRQMNVDPLRTPVHTKYMLFRRFRCILGLYMFLSCALGVLGLMNDATNPGWQWRTVVVDEGLNYVLYVTLGYTFRCRRFRNLLHASMPPLLASPGVQSQENGSHPRHASIAPEPLARAADELQVKRKPTLVVVMNPDQAQSLGTAYHAVPASNPKGNALSDANASPKKNGVDEQ